MGKAENFFMKILGLKLLDMHHKRSMSHILFKVVISIASDQTDLCICVMNERPDTSQPVIMSFCDRKHFLR